MNGAAEFYDRLIAQEGSNPRGLAFVSASSQHLRFCSFVEAVPVDVNDSVLDVGCGFGDLQPYLQQLGHRGDYEGWDISEAAVTEARRRLPHLADRLLRRDALAAAVEEAPVFDWVFSSGAFNVGCSEARGHAAMAKLFARARKGVVLTFQNARGTHRPAPDDGFQRAKYAPEAIYCDAKAVTPWVVLRDDYLPHDFLVALLRRPTWDLRLTADPLTP